MAEIVNSDNFDLKSSPTQELFKIQKGVLDAIKERLVAREAGVSSRLDQIIEKWGLVADYSRSTYHSSMIGHVVTDISLYKRFKQAMTRSPRMKVTACESEQSNFSFWLNEKNRISSYIAEINNFAEIVHAISLPIQLTVNQGNADVVPVKKTLRLRSKEVLGMGPQKSQPSRSFDFG